MYRASFIILYYDQQMHNYFIKHVKQRDTNTDSVRTEPV